MRKFQKSDSTRRSRGRVALAVAFMMALAGAFAFAWLGMPRAVEAPGKEVIERDAIEAVSEEEPISAPPTRTALLRKVTLSPEEELRGPELAYVHDPEDLHDVQLQRIAALTPDTDTSNAILSFANAVMMAGNTWITAPNQMTYLRVKTGETEAYPGMDNPHVFTQGQASPAPLKAYEEKAMALIEKDYGVVWSFEAYGLHAVGGLRNVGSCIGCHEEPENTLLGAVSYVYTELADD